MATAPTLDSLDLAEVRRIARAYGADVRPDMVKAEIIEAIDYTGFDQRTVRDYLFTCRQCRQHIRWLGDAYVVTDVNRTSDGLSYCPPDPDHIGTVGDHVPLTWSNTPRKATGPAVRR